MPSSRWRSTATASIAQSQIAGRIAAVIFNYAGARTAVFHSRQKHSAVFPKYIALVVCNALLSYALIRFMTSRFGLGPIPAKLTAEALLFFASFAIQRDFVFTRRSSETTATNWDEYYTKVPVTATLTRRYTGAVLIDTIRRFATPQDGLSIVEIGGANSCFLDRILSSIAPGSYDVVDTNEYGLRLLAKRPAGTGVLRLHHQSVLALDLPFKADLVFSIGLVEHFDPEQTRKAVLAHFDASRKGGLVIISFPTPTLLYLAARSIIEALGMWKFPDERPLQREEVVSAVRERGEVAFEKTLWPLVPTQHIVVARSR